MQTTVTDTSLGMIDLLEKQQTLMHSCQEKEDEYLSKLEKLEERLQKSQQEFTLTLVEKIGEIFQQESWTLSFGIMIKFISQHLRLPRH